MHELSIALDILDFVKDEMNRRQLDDLRAVGVRIGALSAVDPEALSFGFTVACRETPLEDVRLEIELVPAEIQCEICGYQGTTKTTEFICPRCRSSNLAISQGYELDIAYLETGDDSAS